MFRVVTEGVGSALVTVPLAQDWQPRLETILSAASAPNVAVVWLCSPNNPTGLTLSAEFVQRVLEGVPDAVVVLDEAYAEIAGESLAPLMLASPNGALVRTFSKGYGLAGARVGYVVTTPEIASTLETLRLPQNMTAFGIAAACRALDDQAGLEQRVAELVTERERLTSELTRRGWTVLPSRGNFVLASPSQNAVEVAQWLQGAGLIVRSYPGHARLKDWLRIAARAPEENDRLLTRLDGLR